MNDDERLRHLLSDAVSDVEPQDRIAEIRASVRPDPTVVPVPRVRSWRYAVAGVVATAAVIGVVAWTTSVAGDDPTVLGTSGGGGSGSPAATATDPAAPSSDGASTDVSQWPRSAVYYLGHGPRGTVLYRELSAHPPSVRPLEAAVLGLMTGPVDPDYRTPWRIGWLDSASVAGGLIRVEVGGAPAARPAAMSARDAAEAIQQVVYTVQAAVRRREPVQFLRHGRPASSVLGVPTSRPVAEGRATKVLSLMSISDPAEGVHVERGRLVVTGVNNAFEAAVVVRLERAGTTYLTEPGTASGAYDPRRLFPWTITLDTTRLQPGRYLLVAENGDAQGSGNVDQDTRTIYLE